jgi:hypothetical protein
MEDLSPVHRPCHRPVAQVGTWLAKRSLLPSYITVNQVSTSEPREGVKCIVCFRLFKTKSRTAIKFMRFRGITLLLAGIKEGRVGGGAGRNWS